jgi:2,3-bisphosphoglycerate-dependent phosphoglycerate mutase
MTIFLVRHCAATGQEPEAMLSEAGEAQALELATFLEQLGVTRIVSSPYKRAVDSARPLAERLYLTIETDPRLAERSLGHVEDGDWVAALRRSFEDPHLCLPNGESSRAAQTRGRAVLDEVTAVTRQPIAIFSHGNLLSLIAHSFDATLGFDFWRSLSNPDVVAIQARPGQVTVERIWRDKSSPA